MYLKSIRCLGFKSFADKLDIEINPGITGIVGPNGSGKSNIVDAVRWVLGEQSIKQMRASNMSDVIFSGSATREEHKRAMVALTFDNTDHYLNSDLSEIEVKRIVYKSGENEYYINNNKVRLKDINDLFIDCAGANAFNIISQGNVTDIVNSKPIDRRVIFESAAGVLKYKKRKEESLKKLEKTEENLRSIRLIINELEKTVIPLKKQSEEAIKYKKITSELENIDIALIVEDISEFNSTYNTLKSEIEILKNKLVSTKASEIDLKIENLKLKSMDIEQKLQEKRTKLKEVEQKLYEYTSEKRITLERQKYEVNNIKINDNLVELKEKELKLKKNIDILTTDVTDIENNIKNEREKNETIKDKILVNKVKRSTLSNKLQEKNKEQIILENKKSVLENNILNYTSSPTSVKNILANPRLKGIISTFGKIINTPDEYLQALDVAIGSSINHLVCETEESAAQAIDYLKQNRLGRATFLPLNIIKPRSVDEQTLNDIKNINGFKGVFSDLVSYDKQYENVVQNLLGNIIVVENINVLNIIGKLINYRYKVVSLDGEIFYVGGSIAGGISKKNSLINEKNELHNIIEELSNLNIEIENINNDLDEYNKKIEELENEDVVVNKYVVLLNDELFNKKTNLSHLIEEHKNILDEIKGLEDLQDNKLDDRIIELLENINATTKEQEILTRELNNLENTKKELDDNLIIALKEQKDENSSYKTLANNLKEKEVSLAKIEVNLDNLLITLNNDYNKTYEYASVNYTLDMDKELARSKVKELKEQLSLLQNVNLGAISEYERLNKRYTFLNHQKEDLESSSKEFLTIINEMDEIMIDKFKTTFDKIQKEFSRIFKLMFKGGTGKLELTDPSDLLTTGIEIIAIPPGKKINSPMSLSGGEKALTAIVLLFSLLEVRPSPFVILDEAEAALDEVNVDMFGKYLNEEKNKSQFIVITHKKRMMEYADSLYGITMQESGVSKIVSAKLENVN